MQMLSNKQEVDKMIVTVGELQEVINYEIERLNDNYTNNTSKNVNKMLLLLQCMTNIPQNVVFTVDGVRGNSSGTSEQIRDFRLPNTGSVIECVVKYHQSKGALNEISKSFIGVDMKKGKWNVEIKTSLTANSLATASENELTILVNRIGVWQIKKNEVKNYTNANGRLPHNKPCGRLLKGMTELLGFNI